MTGSGTGGAERSERLDQAAHWIARLRHPAVSARDRDEFGDWLDADIANPDAFDEMALLWQRLEVVKQLPLATTPSRRFLSRPILAAAAAILMLIGAAAILLTGADAYATRVGEQRNVVLDDGSRMALNTDTRVRVELAADRRDVTLQRGEAYFEVTPDPERPFVVRTPHGSVRAVGTAFCVRVLADRSRVMVRSGEVAVYPASETDPSPSALGAGAGLEFDARDVGRAQHIDVSVATAWREGRLIYDGVTLAQMIEDLNRYMPRKMVIGDTELAQTRVSAVLRVEEQQATLNALSRILPLRWVELSDDLILLRPKT